MRIKFFTTLCVCIWVSLVFASQDAVAKVACGGDGQPSCAYSKATFRGKTCSGANQFLDPRNGGECWACPNHYDRTVRPVTDDKACQLKLLKPTKATLVVKKTACSKNQFFDPRKGGECWSCAKGYDRTGSSVTSKDACKKPAHDKFKKAEHKRYAATAFSCHKGEIWDSYNRKKQGAGCWTCKKSYKRSGHHIAKSKACYKTVKPKWKKAKFHHKEGAAACKTAKGEFWDPRKKGQCWSCPDGYIRSASGVTKDDACITTRKGKQYASATGGDAACKKGQFRDPRKGGECWSCPKDMGRSIDKVTSPRACAKPLLDQAVAALKGKTVGCEKGLIEVDAKCYTKNVCGCYKKRDCKKQAQRACTLDERFPSCVDGYRESRGTCIKLKPGEIAFLASLSEYSRDFAAAVKGECHEVLDILPVIKTTGLPTKDTTELKYFTIGFACASTDELDKFAVAGKLQAAIAKIGNAASTIDEFRKEASEAGRRKPCAEWDAVWRPVCSYSEALLKGKGGAAKCALETIKTAKITASGKSKKERWLTAGELAYKVVGIIVDLTKKDDSESSTETKDPSKDSSSFEKLKAKAKDLKAKWNDSDLKQFMDFIDKIRSVLEASGYTLKLVENVFDKKVSGSCDKAI